MTEHGMDVMMLVCVITSGLCALAALICMITVLVIEPCFKGRLLRRPKDYEQLELPLWSVRDRVRQRSRR